MKNKRYSDVQIMGILKQAESGVPVSELCREHWSKADQRMIQWIIVPPNQRQLLQVAGEVWRDGCFDDFRIEGDGRGKSSPEADVCRDEHAERPAEGGAWKKALWPSLRKEMAVQAVTRHGVSIALACRAFQISERCYRYERQLSDENAEIAEWPPLGDCSNHLPVEV